MEKVEPLAPPDGIEGDCLMWTANVGRKRAALFYAGSDKGQVLAHVWIWNQARGPVPSGKVIHHRCERRTCMNVNHMVLLTPSEHARESHSSRHWFKPGHETWSKGKRYRIWRIPLGEPGVLAREVALAEEILRSTPRRMMGISTPARELAGFILDTHPSGRRKR